MPRTQPCPECGTGMEYQGNERRIFEPDPETMTDGQLAEQLAAKMGAHYEEGMHGVTIEYYHCPKCNEQVEVR
ncbi:hypothetical protein ACFR9U_07165 [Halorientalis brevis]|uniref:Small CPxCG-related zinc finger protein n=1 Tax=Halorientalis brevis TaxID=1126241 RepID=A0ABD6CAL7_9EURY|nr:hypothetical protein [Halorientalis brevis]